MRKEVEEGKLGECEEAKGDKRKRMRTSGRERVGKR